MCICMASYYSGNAPVMPVHVHAMCTKPFFSCPLEKRPGYEASTGDATHTSDRLFKVPYL